MLTPSSFLLYLWRPDRVRFECIKSLPAMGPVCFYFFHFTFVYVVLRADLTQPGSYLAYITNCCELCNFTLCQRYVRNVYYMEKYFYLQLYLCKQRPLKRRCSFFSFCFVCILHSVCYYCCILHSEYTVYATQCIM